MEVNTLLVSLQVSHSSQDGLRSQCLVAVVGLSAIAELIVYIVAYKFCFDNFSLNEDDDDNEYTWNFI